MDTKKNYSKPEVISYGNIEKVTKVEGPLSGDGYTGSTS